MNQRETKIITETLNNIGVPANYYKFRRLDEAKSLEVADVVLSDMFKFITDKYNSIDFKEIDSSAGLYSKFKYKNIISSNINTLATIYKNCDEGDAKKYVALIDKISEVEKFLIRREFDISYLYKKRRGVIQVIYTASVAALIYSVAALISNTIRFVTVDKNSDIELKFDEIPSAYKNIHIKNIEDMANSLSDFDKLLHNMIDESKKTLVNESVGSFFTAPGRLASGIAKGAGNLIVDSMKTKKARDAAKNVGAAISNNKGLRTAGYVASFIAAAVLVWKSATLVLNIIRSIVMAIYYTRVRIKEALEINLTLLNANIEELESNGADKKVIANQRKWVTRLESLIDKFNLATDRGEVATKKEIDRQNSQMDPERMPEDDDIMI